MEINLIPLIKTIAGFAAPLAKKELDRNEAIIRLKNKFFPPDHLPDDFGIVYAYTLVEYGLGKEEQLLELFRQEEIKQAFRRAFEENNLSILQKEGEDFLDWNILGDKIREREIEPRREFAAFSVVFHEIVPCTRKPSQVIQNRQLQEILEQLPKLNTLEEIRTLLVHLLQSYQPHPNELEQQSGNVLEERLEETVKLYLTKSFSEDGFAELDQAGEIDPDRRTPLKQVFIDLDAKSRQGSKPSDLRLESLPQSARRLSFDNILSDFEAEMGDSLSVMICLLKECCPKVVVIGGPGQGKSTLGQQLAQVHRAKLLGKPYDFEPQIERIPFRVVLKYFAQWLADKSSLEGDDLEAYLAERVGKLAARPGSVSTEDIQEIVRCRPCVLILDGLDEVVVPELQKRMLARIQDFLERSEILGANLTVVATSRPNVYENQFDPEQFWHLELQRLSTEKVFTYAKKWVKAKNLSEEEQNRILPTLEECQQDGNIASLLTTPLQVTIILLIIKDGGRPPSQREALFNEYWSIIFRREKSKAKGIIQSDETILFALHAYLGYLLHRRASEKNIRSLLPEEEFSQAVREFLRKEDRRSSEEAINSKMKLLVQDAQERLVLIVSPEPGWFGFELRSFQEFFAAVHLAQTASNTQQRFDRLKAIACSQHWRNVALLFAGRLARNFRGEASNILELVCRPVDRGEPNRYLKPGAWFALEIAADGALSANRNLQYNAVEYGLEVLETGLTEEQQDYLISLTQRLSKEDQRDILCPALEEKLNCLPLGCLEDALTLYSQAFGSTPLFQEKIDVLLQTRQKNTVLSAFNLALSCKSDPSWMVERLQAYWSCSPIDLSDLCFRSSEYTEQLLSVWQVSDIQATQIAEAISVSFWRYQPWRSKQELVWDMPEPKTSSDQLILILRCIGLINYWANLSLNPEKVDLDEVYKVSLPAIGVRMRIVKPQPLLPVSDEIADALDSLLQRSELIPLLRLNLWALFYYIKEPDFANISDFIKTIRSVKEISAINERLWWYYSGLREKIPLLALAVKRQKIEGNEVVNKLMPFLKTNTQVSIAEQVVGTIQKYIEQSNNMQQKQFYIAVQAQIELDKLLPQLVPLAGEMGITVEELVDVHIVSYGYEHPPLQQIECTIDQIQQLLTAAEEAIEDTERLWKLILSFSRITLPFKPDVLKQAQQLLEMVLERWSNYSDLTAAKISITLFLKLLPYNTEVEQIAPRLFANLSPTELVNFRRWTIPEIFDGLLSSKCLSVLKSFLIHEQEAVRVGSAILLKALVSMPVHYKEFEKSKDIQELRSIRFNVDLGQGCISSDNSERRLIGIAILSLSDYPIEDVNYQRSLLEALEQTQNTEEQEAWVELLKEVPMSDKKHTIWCNLLEKILGQPWRYSNSVLSAAMQRYQVLASPAKATILESEEKALELL